MQTEVYEPAVIDFGSNSIRAGLVLDDDPEKESKKNFHNLRTLAGEQRGVPAIHHSPLLTVRDSLGGIWTGCLLVLWR